MDYSWLVRDRSKVSRLLRTGLASFLVCLFVSILPHSALGQATPASNPTTVSIQQGGIGKISGKISNETSPGPFLFPATQLVKLERVAVSSGNTVDIQQTSADRNGNFLFQNLPLDSSYSYYISTQYSGVTYYVQNEIKLNSSQPNQSVELKIYETTNDSSLVSIVGTTMVIPQVDTVNGQLLILEMYSLQNKSNRTYIGQFSTSSPTPTVLAIPPTMTAEPTRRSTTLSFYLPAGATGLTPAAGIATEDIIITTAGIEISTPILPGDSQLVFNYRLGYTGKTLSFSKKLAYDTPTFRLFTPLAGPKAVSKLLVPGQAVQMGQQQLSTLTGQNFKANTNIDILLNDLPLPPNQELFATRDIVLKIGLLLTLLASLGFLLVYSRRYSNSKVQTQLFNANDTEATLMVSPAMKRIDEVESHRRKLLYELARLDNSFADGEFDGSDGEYRQQRLVYKRELLEIWSEISQPMQLLEPIKFTQPQEIVNVDRMGQI